MLKPAQLYADQLRTKILETWYQPEDIYWNGGAGDSIPDLPEDNSSKHCFVSVDKRHRVIGYICYYVDWVAMSAESFGIISFDKGNLEFIKDLYRVIDELLTDRMNRISWSCYADNPAIRGYRNFIRRHGGRECGYYRQYARLQDGKLHDSVMFEILAEEYRREK